MNVEPWGVYASGDTGIIVRAIQFLLRVHSHPVAVDGSYGPVTAAGIEGVQTSAGLPADGVLGPNTWPHLVIPTGPGSTGDAVRAIQQFPLFPYPDLVVDGSYGPATEEQVRVFQLKFGLTQDGAAGRETWSFKSAEGTAWPLVKPGATTTTNYRVPIVQHLLRAHGATIVADGSYGPATGEAVRQFQLTLRAQYISTTVGQLDWPALFVTVGPGDTGAAVRGVQYALNAHGESLVEDGSFGPLTEAAVREFQRMWTESVDGVVGPLTWRAIVLPKTD